MDYLISLVAVVILAYIAYDIYRRDFCKHVRFDPKVEYNEFDPEAPPARDFEEPLTIDASFDSRALDEDFVVLDEEDPRRPLVPRRVFLKLQHGGEPHVVYAELRWNRDLADMFLRVLDGAHYKDAHVLELRRGAWLRFGNKYAEKALFGSPREKDRLPNARGTISVVPNSSDFIVNLGPNADLDGRAFPIGVVTHGMEFLERIGRGEARGTSPMTVTSIEAAGRL